MLPRRRFIGQCCAAVGLTGMASTLASLRATVAAASIPSGSSTPGTAAAVDNDYRALVCIFLNGGNDASNLIIPNDAGYAAYAASRSVLAIPQTGLLGLSPKTTDGRAWALHPSLAELHSLFGSGKMALLANVGTLVEPTTKAQWSAGTVKLPPQLFSHNDQQVQWQSSVPDQPFKSGWGGRMADLVNSLHTNNQVSMSVTLNGFNHLRSPARSRSFPSIPRPTTPPRAAPSFSTTPPAPTTPPATPHRKTSSPAKTPTCSRPPSARSPAARSRPASCSAACSPPPPRSTRPSPTPRSATSSRPSPTSSAFPASSA